MHTVSCDQSRKQSMSAWGELQNKKPTIVVHLDRRMVHPRSDCPLGCPHG